MIALPSFRTASHRAFVLDRMTWSFLYVNLTVAASVVTVDVRLSIN